MISTICLVLLLLAAGAAFLIARKVVDDFDRAAWRLGGGALVLIFAVWFVLATFVVVSTRNVGIVTTFGRPVGTLPNGLHFTWPWQSVTEMDGAIQIDQHRDDNASDGDNHGGALQVRLGNSSTAYADTSVRWEIKLDSADDLFLQYKTFENVQTNLVTRNLQVALNEVFASYDPLAPQNLDVSPLPGLAAQATKILQDKVGSQITVLEVQVPTIKYDQGTEDRINQLNQQRAQTSIAKEAQKTAEEQAKANAAISASLNNDPNVLVSKCLDIVKEKGGSPFGCWPGASAVPTMPLPGAK
jgi:regulator of protease activity HflC (stomatin/prohibitin superfamily)